MDKERVGDGFGSYVKALKYQERISEKNPESGRFFREGTKKKEDLQIVNKLTKRRKMKEIRQNSQGSTGLLPLVSRVK